MKSVLKIKGSVKNYEWGKIGLNSVVARLQKTAFNSFIDENLPYAELWMGTHSSGPSLIPSENEMKLIDWIHNNPESLGENITRFWDASNGLPFLFKVLSVRKALSIQVHPDKETAVELHKRFSEYYPDDNHKPEIAVALTNFEALCGFRPLYEIEEFLLAVPELQTLVKDEILQTFLSEISESNLKHLFTALMTCPENVFQPVLVKICDNFKVKAYENNICKSIEDLFLRTVSQYPADIGCFCLFFLNYVKLEPGEAIFCAANEPHAYLSGDCIECMACSDNVVRAGLTPKFKDVQTLCNMLTYKCRSSSENIFPYVTDSLDPHVKSFKPPVREFAVDYICLPNSCNSYSLKCINSASILLVTEGKAIYECNNETDHLYSGNILFISCKAAVSIYPKEQIVMFRSYCS